MKWWPWSRKPTSDGGSAARRQAEERLEEVRAQWPEVHRVSGSLRDLRRRNGFSEQLTYILRGNGENRS